MSKSLAGILAVACCCLGALCFRYQSQVRELQKRNTELTEMMNRAEKTLGTHTREREVLEAEIARKDVKLAEAIHTEEVLTKELEEAKKTALGTDQIVELVPEVVGENDLRKKPDKKANSAGFMGKLQELMDKPGMRDAMRSQQKMALNMMYGSLFTKLKLDPERLDLLKNLLVDQQMAGLDAVGSKDMQGMKDVREGTEEAVEELLTDEEYDVFEDYQKTIAERVALQQLDQVLAQKSMPMTEVQREELITLMVEERQALAIPDAMEQQEQFMKDGMPGEAQLEKYLVKQEQYNLAVQKRAGEVLNKVQVEELRTFQESQIQMQKLGMQMMKGMMGGDDKKD